MVVKNGDYYGSKSKFFWGQTFPLNNLRIYYKRSSKEHRLPSLAKEHQTSPHFKKTRAFIVARKEKPQKMG